MKNIKQKIGEWLGLTSLFLFVVLLFMVVGAISSDPTPSSYDEFDMAKASEEADMFVRLFVNVAIVFALSFTGALILNKPNENNKNKAS